MGRRLRTESLLWVLILAAVALAAATVTPAAAAKKKVVRDEYDVQAVPFAMAGGELNGHYGCLAGPEGVSKVSRTFEVPFDGIMTATVEGFVGDWDIYLLDETGEDMLAVANRGVSNLEVSIPDTFKHPLRRGQKVQLVVCNYLGGPTAHVKYEHKGARVPPEPPPSHESFHQEEVSYDLPAVAGTWPTRFLIYASCGQGCLEVPFSSDDRYMTVEVDDVSGSDVAGVIAQYTETAYIRDAFCGKTDDAVELIPDLTYLEVQVYAAPCEGRTGGATSGTVTATLSSSPISSR